MFGKIVARFLVGILSVLACGAYAAAERSAIATRRPVEWARPIDVVGVSNLHQVASNFYRSAQPDARGFKTLATKYGVKTIVSLRAFNADEAPARGLDLRLVRYKIHTWHIEREDVVGALHSLRRAMSEAPVLLHCQHGADRTGLISALYRILYDSWSKQAAIDEMLNGNFGYHAVWGNIPRYIQRVDVEQLRRDVELPEPAI